MRVGSGLAARQNLRGPRTGSVLAAVLVSTLVVGVMGLALVQRTVRSSRTAGWSRDHLVLRMVAESAAEELYLGVQTAANVPSDPIFRDVRVRPAGSPAFAGTPLKGLGLSNLTNDLQGLEKTLGGSIKLKHTVLLCDQKPLAPGAGDPGDALEQTGTLVIEVTAQLTRNRTTTVERLRVQREFKTSRVTPPRPFDQVGLFIGKTSSKDLARFKGRSAYAVSSETPQTLQELLTHKAPEGFAMLPGKSRSVVKRALGSMTPGSLIRRAHFVVADHEALLALIAHQLDSGSALNGIVHVTSPDPIRLEFPSFRGKCLLSFSGPVDVADIRVDDPGKDSLTIVSPERIVVVGRNVEASLVNPSDVDGGIVFQQKAHVKGAVVVVRFPRANGLSAQEWGACQFQANRNMASGAGPAGPPDQGMLSCYTTAFSPYPVSVEHARDGEAW
ncbi:MAG: hypothetical protein HY815_05715 [Candidatus Riflebacteria bacterium]|nr:hypothetical protein [Candidatus Riflebacteria bacterium]